MGRYTGPKRRLERRENTTLFNTDNWRKRPTPPGQHGKTRGRMSSFAVQFREKQKVKRMYGLYEKQFNNTYLKASKESGNTSTHLLRNLELRLDNVVFRLGLAKTRTQARQFVSHGHILVNEQKIDVPSFTCKKGDTIKLNTKLGNSTIVKEIRSETKTIKTPDWLEQYSDGGIVKEIPGEEHFDKGIKAQLIIELYSR